MPNNSRSVSVIVPCRNEFLYIESFLSGFNGQSLSTLYDYELIVIDGLSDDGTYELLLELEKSCKYLKVSKNIYRTTPHALNLGLQIASHDYIVRMDVHTSYDSYYIENSIQFLEAHPDCFCVGGAWNARVPQDNIDQASIALAFSSPIASGGARSRLTLYNGEVDTVYLGAWRKSELLKLGGFDVRFSRNQDDELCLRAKEQGLKIYQSSTIMSAYYVRNSFEKLCRQFYQYGFWKPVVAFKHRKHASARHLLPAFFVCLQLLLIILSFFYWPFFSALVVIYVLYSVALLVSSYFVCRNAGGYSLLFRIFYATCLMHFAYGFGYLVSLLTFAPFRILRGARSGGYYCQYSGLTR